MTPTPFLAAPAAPSSVQSNSEADRLLTADQLASRWQVKTATVYALARDGAVPTVRLGRRLVRFRLAEIVNYEQKGGQADD